MMEENTDDLETYLRDHYAGGVGATELLQHLVKTHEEKPLGPFLKGVLADVESDLETLHELMSALGFEESRVRNVGAWMAEKFGRAKLGSGGETYDLPLLQALETLALGITGKRLLWRGSVRCAPRIQRCKKPVSRRWESALRNNSIGLNQSD